MEKNVEMVKFITTFLLGILILIFFLVLPKKGNHLFKFSLSLILGGALSNVYDRLTRGYVVDYFSFKAIKKIVFNISDIMIFIGAALVALISFFKSE